MTKTDRQREYLRKRAAENRALERCCDCIGGIYCNNTDKPCSGFARDCLCDKDMSFLPWRKNAEQLSEQTTEQPS